MTTLRDEFDPDTSRHLRPDEIAKRVQIEREHDPDAERGHTSGGHGDSLARETREHRRRCPGCGMRLKKGARQCPECSTYVWSDR